MLIGNHTEDRFGKEIAEAPYTKWTFPKSEMKSKYTVQGSMMYKGRDNFPAKPQNEDEIINEKASHEFSKTEKDLKHGQPMHILFGHGAT